MSSAEIDLPPSDEERSRVIDVLRAAGGRLGLHEAERRMDAAVSAGTKGDLALLIWDLPDTTALPAMPAPKVRAWSSPWFRAHAATYGMVNSMLVGIWELTTPHGLFWPFFPIAGWGIGLAGNAFGVRAHQRHRYRRQVRRLEKLASRPVTRSLPPDPAGRYAYPGASAGRTRRGDTRLAPDAHQGGGDRERDRAPSASAPTSVSKPVVVMFTDVVDSTRLNLVIGDEDWARLRRRYRAMMQEAYAEYNGREVNTAGDGFLARFERPGDAVGCAVAIQRRLNAQREEYGFAPAVRIGVNAGPAVEEQGDVLGSTVNLASRVTASAEPGEILVTEVVADLLDDRFRLTDAGLRDLKGLDRKAHVLSVGWA